MTTPGKPLRSDGAETRTRLKEEAQRLFALRGLEGVSVQDIISAAGQRNSASLRYYFGNKLELARELVVDGARLIDEDRQARLDKLEAEGALSVRAVLGALLFPMLELADRTGQPTYIRMIANLQLNDRAFLREALENKWNAGYQRCNALLRDLLPDIDPTIVDHRLSLVGIYGNAVLAAWEASRDSGEPGRLWAPGYAVSNLMDTFEGMLVAAPSEETRSLLGESKSNRETAR
ncbi:TetR/AcrR family transcriptional regulator [Paraburkholderia acidiphila]|uniref:TetR family transcriptional regulator n=1 Tax=Paraburkholderia acidiphila TaxID=2571747 RepID=A0A7Z2G9F3_9BURK|nr:TetR/AcrR family transcriptional regulator [Paraburkholderia acidiphila]QGZ57490.1 TetR family transcriptional regulator [Paraburkholderia acidiphila]